MASIARPYSEGMSLLDHTPEITAAEAELITADLFGVIGVATALPSERDLAFRLDSESGTFVLKVSNATETRESLAAQLGAADAAARHGLPVQQTLSTTTGDRLGEVDGHLVRLLEYLPGTLLADVSPAGPALLRDLGATMGSLAEALVGYDHPAVPRDFHWDVARAAEVVRERRSAVTDPARHEILDLFLARFDAEVSPHLGELRRGVIHGDANDHNVVVDPGHRDLPHERFSRVSGLLDFGDLMHSVVVAEVAVAAAYMALDSDDPVTSVCQVVAGFHERFPLTEAELAVLWNLVIARPALSVVNAAVQSAQRPDDPYLVVSEAPAWRGLATMLAIDQRGAHYRLRDACGLEAHPAAAEVRSHLAASGPAPLLGVPWADLRTFPVDLSVGSELLDATVFEATTDEFDALLRSTVGGDPDAIGLGGYGEARLLYTTPAFASSDDPASERRTVHLGLDVWTRVGAALHAPLRGVVHIVRDNDSPLDYGPVVVLRHETAAGTSFFSLYGHLARETLHHLVEGQVVEAGERFAWAGSAEVNGGWAPHAHVQLILDLLGLDHDYPGVGVPSLRDFWLGLSPDPALLLGLPAGSVPVVERPFDQTLADRQRLLAPSLSVSYDPPLRIVRGIAQTLYDDQARGYLDSVNNVAHVGHARPEVVRAGARQMGVLNTNTRYLHETVLRYAERLTATLPEPLSVCFFVNSGSEANDLALRLMRAHTGADDVVAVEHGYHGHTQALIDVSHYKHAGRGGRGAPEWAHIAAMPDPYRGEHRGYSRDTARAYAVDVSRCVDEAGGRVAGMIVESMIGCGGQVVLPDGYLADAAAVIRGAGGLMIADEVQVGFGRVGPEFWGFATQGLVPDIVTVGKPAGNGHPLAAVVTTPEIAASFANGMEYFNTFGGNPVSAAIGLAVLDVIEADDLPANAARLGARIVDEGRELMGRHQLIGDVRGLGLYVGIELVRDRASLEPAAAEAAFVIERMKRLGVLVSTDGPHHNVLKIKPPLVWTDADVDRLLSTLDRVLGDRALQG